METGVNLTGYDFVILGIILLFIARGIWLGLLKQVTGLMSIVVAYYAASQYHDRLFPFLKDLSDNPKVVFVVSVVILFILAYVVTFLLGKGLSHVIEIVISKWFDKLLGGLLGAGMAAVAVVFLHMILSSILAPENTILRECTTCSALNGATEYTREFIRDEEVRKALMQQSPAIAAEEVLRMLEGQPSEEQPAGDAGKSTVVE